MVLADGVVRATELEALYRIGIERYGITPDEINREIMSAGTSLVPPETLNEKIELLYYMAILAWADGKIEDSERDLLKKYVIKMDFLPENADAITDYLLKEVEKKVPLEEILYNISNNKKH